MTGRHRRSSAAWLRSISSRPPVILTVVALAVMAVVGGAVVFTRLNTANSTNAATTQSPGTPWSPGTAQSTAAATDLGSGTRPRANARQTRRADLADCQVYFRQQLSAAQAAAVSLNQWREHIQAMNQLVAGLITLDRAAQYWNQTRKGAMHKVATFERLQQQLTASGCAQPASGGHRLAVCNRATTAYQRVLDAARITVATWQMHIDDMESLRNGLITPQRATKLWIHKWRVGAHQLGQYDRVAARAQGKTCA